MAIVRRWSGTIRGLCIMPVGLDMAGTGAIVRRTIGRRHLFAIRLITARGTGLATTGRSTSRVIVLLPTEAGRRSNRWDRERQATVRHKTDRPQTSQGGRRIGCQRPSQRRKGRLSRGLRCRGRRRLDLLHRTGLRRTGRHRHDLHQGSDRRLTRIDRRCRGHRSKAGTVNGVRGRHFAEEYWLRMPLRYCFSARYRLLRSLFSF